MPDFELHTQEIGKRVMERRKKLGPTQEALAEKSDLTTQSISYTESGKRRLRLDTMAKIASALGVSVDYILTGNFIDKDRLLLSEKLDRLTATELGIVENIVDECIALYHRDE